MKTCMSKIATGANCPYPSQRNAACAMCHVGIIRPALLPPSALTSCVDNSQARAQRIWQMGCYPYRTASASGGSLIMPIRRAFATVRKVVDASLVPLRARGLGCAYWMVA